MSIQRQSLFWLAAFAALAAFVYVFSGILVPFVAAIILAYLLDPLVEWLQRKGVPRAAATILVVVVFVMVFVLAILAILPLLAQQLTQFIASTPEYWKRLQGVLQQYVYPLLLPFGGVDALREVPSHIASGAGDSAKWLSGILSSLLSGGQTLIGILSLLVITPVVAFYMLLDWNHMIAKVDSWLPLRHRETIRQLVREMNASVYGFLRGQALICLILGSFYALALTFTGLNFGFLIGVASGLLNFIPYVGSTTGFVVAIGVAIAQFPPEWGMVVLVGAIFVFGQFVDGNILQPKLLGEAVGLHPVWLIFALLGAGSVLGFVGVMIAVPLAGAIGVLVRFMIRQYLASPLYNGRASGTDATG